MAIYSFEGRGPRIDPSSFIHEEATLIGRVTIGKNCYVAPGACLRGDWGTIEIGDDSNIQENVIIHVRDELRCILGPQCHIGHGAIIHTSILGRHVMVGMGAIVQDLAEIGDECVIGAGAVVLARAKVPPGKLLVGVPARVVGDVPDEVAKEVWAGTRAYQELPERMMRGLRKI